MRGDFKEKKEKERGRYFMDITKFNTVQACEEGAWVTILDFDEIPTDIEFKVVGIDSKKFKERVNLLTRKNEGKSKQDMVKLEEDTIRLLASITLDWKGVEDSEGKVIEFTLDAVENVYRNSPWISEQIIEFAKSRRNFLSER